jgi:HEPN domain-containing protein
MADKAIIEEWLNKAEEEYEFASSIMEDTTFYSQLCFHFHQAAEKYLKTYIIANDLEFKKIHDLMVLLKICLSKNKEFEKLRNSCKFINRFYIETRYPVHWPTSFTKDEVIRASGHAGEIRKLIRSLVTETK